MSAADWYAEVAMRGLGMEGVGLAGDALRRALTAAFEAGERAGAAGAARAHDSEEASRG